MAEGLTAWRQRLRSSRRLAAVILTALLRRLLAAEAHTPKPRSFPPAQPPTQRITQRRRRTPSGTEAAYRRIGSQPPSPLPRLVPVVAATRAQATTRVAASRARSGP